MNNNRNKTEGVTLEEVFPLIEEKLNSGGQVTFKPHGVSMLPLIRQGRDSANIKKLTRKPKKFDAIFYRRSDGQFVLHRIIGKNKKGFILCGDNQFVKEYGITEAHIKGILTSVSREDGKDILCESIGMKVYCRLLVFRRLYLKALNFYRRVKRRLKKKTV